MYTVVIMIIKIHINYVSMRKYIYVHMYVPVLEVSLVVLTSTIVGMVYDPVLVIDLKEGLFSSVNFVRSFLGRTVSILLLVRSDRLLGDTIVRSLFESGTITCTSRTTPITDPRGSLSASTYIHNIYYNTIYTINTQYVQYNM
jgi:hypothetical protein